MKLMLQRSISVFTDLRVLILDDIALQQEMLVDALNAMGISFVTQAADCTSALRVLRSTGHSFDIVLCNMKMKGMDEGEFIYHAAQCNVGGFILMSVAKDELLCSATTIAHGCGSHVLGVLASANETGGLRQLLLCYLDTAAAAPSNEDKPWSQQWTRSELVSALNGNQFVPFFQPKIDLDTGVPTCVEILARWNHPDLGMLPPSQFVELMEQEGLIDQLTGSLLLQSLACARECAASGRDIGFAINVSPLTLQDARTPTRICSLVKACGLSPARITIEVTETASAKSFTRVLESLTRLRMQGFEISVDDFGMGYSSLQQLSRMPFTELKIDRSFISDVSSNTKSAAILESIIQLAGKLRLRTVAEGIETSDELDLVQSLGCGVGQGFLLGRPMAQPDLIDYLEQTPSLEAA
ncbi:EAL domain-containing protein [Undibacterium arcticum]|uniref:EAL domain-containing protein n=2 Tax=Undibacterium arcticum TaxID=1762892 RepID=A0ABV7EUV7_9BURK